MICIFFCMNILTQDIIGSSQVAAILYTLTALKVMNALPLPGELSWKKPWPFRDTVTHRFVTTWRSKAERSEGVAQLALSKRCFRKNWESLTFFWIKSLQCFTTVRIIHRSQAPTAAEVVFWEWISSSPWAANILCKKQPLVPGKCFHAMFTLKCKALSSSSVKIMFFTFFHHKKRSLARAKIVEARPEAV